MPSINMNNNQNNDNNNDDNDENKTMRKRKRKDRTSSSSSSSSSSLLDESFNNPSIFNSNILSLDSEEEEEKENGEEENKKEYRKVKQKIIESNLKYNKSLQPKIKKIIEGDRTISVYGKQYRIPEGEVKKLSQQHSFFQQLFENIYSEGNQIKDSDLESDLKSDINSNHVIILELPFSARQPLDWTDKYLKGIVDLFSMSPKELFRTLDISATLSLFSYEHWLFLGSFAHYVQAEDHYLFVLFRLRAFVQERRSVLGQTWDDLLPIFQQQGEPYLQMVIQMLTRGVEEPQFLDRLYEAWEYPISKTLPGFPSLYDSRLLVNPYHPDLEIYQDMTQSLSIDTCKACVWKISATEQQQQLIHTPNHINTFKFAQADVLYNRINDFSLGFIDEHLNVLPRFALAGGLLSLLLHADLSPFEAELEEADMDLWFLAGGNALDAAKLFVEHIIKKYQNLDLPNELYAMDIRSGLVTVQTLKNPKRKFQFISQASSNAANIIINFDFYHLQWYWEPLSQQISFEDSISEESAIILRQQTPAEDPIVGRVSMQIRGTKMAWIAMQTRWTSTSLPQLRQMRLAKALSRGFNVHIPKDVLIVREPFSTQLRDPEFAPSNGKEYVQALSTFRQNSVLNQIPLQVNNSNNNINNNSLINSHIFSEELNNDILPHNLVVSWQIMEKRMEEFREKFRELLKEKEEKEIEEKKEIDNNNIHVDEEEKKEEEQKEEEEKEGSLFSMSKEEKAYCFESVKAKEEDEIAFMEIRQGINVSIKANNTFEVKDQTLMSQYNNLLQTSVRDIKDRILPCFQMRTGLTPQFDYRSFNKKLSSVWSFEGDNEWGLTTPFRIELPPLLTTIIQSKLNSNQYLLYLKTPSLQDWKNVPALKSFISFLNELQQLALLRQEFFTDESKKEQVKELVSSIIEENKIDVEKKENNTDIMNNIIESLTPMNMKFYEHSEYGTQLRLNVCGRVGVQRLKRINEDSSTFMVPLSTCLEKKLPTTGWMRVCLEFTGIRNKYWEYRPVYLSEVMAPRIQMSLAI